MPVITTEQLAQLQAKVATLVADKADADAKTAASNTADTAATQANAAAAQAKLDEQTADSKASADLLDLQAFIDGLENPLPPPPPPAPAPVGMTSRAMSGPKG